MQKLVPYFGTALILTILFGTIYVTVQQSQRHDANYPQVQIAEDIASGLDKGVDPTLLAAGSVDLATDLSPFTVIYDKSGEPVAGSGRLGGHLPMAPAGMLAAASNKPYSSVTWQPQAGVRIATVTVASKQYYVLSGRSLALVEHNETVSLQLAALGWAISIVVLCGTYAAQFMGAKLRIWKTTES